MNNIWGMMRSYVDGETIQRSRHNIIDTPLNKLFFSKGNVDKLQKMIANNVERHTGYRIGRQPDANLFQIMRTLYMETRHDDYRYVAKQVNELNRMVVRDAVHIIVPSLELHMEHLKRVDRNPVPTFDRPTMMSREGTKSFDISPFEGVEFQKNDFGFIDRPAL